MGGEVKGIFKNIADCGARCAGMGKVFTPAQAAPSFLLAYAAIRVQRAASKEAMLHHAMGQEKDKHCQNNDEKELQESTQTHSPLIWVHRIPGRSHPNRLSGHRLQVAVQSALPLYIVRRRDRRVDSSNMIVDPERLSAGILSIVLCPLEECHPDVTHAVLFRTA